MSLFEQHILSEIDDEFSKKLERVHGIEPSYTAWKAGALPLCYTRSGSRPYSTDCVSGGGDWIRTSVRKAGRFTVCWI